MEPTLQKKYNQKLKELRERMPFLLKFLEKVKDSSATDQSREAQLNKMKRLSDLLNDQTQMLKWDTLIKCETVVQKLQKKMEQQTDYPDDNKVSSNQKAENASKQAKEKDLRQKAERFEEFKDGPESPPPQQDIEDDSIFYNQPVEIPTERCCTPPSSSQRKIYNCNQDEYNHRQYHNMHQKSHAFQNPHENYYKKYDSPNVHLNKNAMEYNRRSSPAHKQTDDYRLQSKWQPPPPVATSGYSSEEEWPSTESNGNNFPDSYKSSNVFSRLGEKVPDAKDPGVFENFQINIKNHRAKQALICSTAKPSSITPELLKSPPLSAKDISLLLSESNSNSNSNTVDCNIDISEIGTRRSTAIISNLSSTATENNSSSYSNLEMVRRKFALLTKRDSPSPISSPLADGNFPSKPSATLPTERVALKYNPHPRGTTTTPISGSVTVTSNLNQNNRSLLGNAIPTIDSSNKRSMPDINVLPSVHPNDPRLRRSKSVIAETLPSAKNIPTIISNQVIQPNITIPTIHTDFLSPQSISMSPSTPSPVYANVSLQHKHSEPVRPQAQITDPRLRRNSTASKFARPKSRTSYASDSSEENWVTDDNACDNLTLGMPTQTLQAVPNFKSHNANIFPANRSFETAKNPFASSVLPARPPWERCNDSPSEQHANKFSHNRPQGLVEGERMSQPNWHKNSQSIPDKSKGFQNCNPKNPKITSEPRTYGAYKQAKARAVAEREAVKRSIVKAKPIAQTDSENDDKRPQAPITNTTLDTMYRSNNLNICDLPKTISSFKIPKRPATVTTSPTTPSNSPSTEEEKVKEKHLEKGKAKESISSKKEKDIGKEKSDFVVNETPPLKSLTEDKKKQKESVNSKVLKETKLATSEDGLDKEKKKDMNLLELDTQKSTEAIIRPEVTKENAKPQRAYFRKKLEENAKNKKDVIKSGEENKITRINNSQRQIIDEIGVADIDRNFNMVNNSPGRVLKRRCTMFDQPSAPEVDKEKLFKASSMLFEDLQDQERKKKVNENSEAQSNSNRRVTGEICYEKTDDGCTVSTQNILSGKRRTRTTANFNEVQRMQAIFKHLKTSTSAAAATDQKKDSLKSETKEKGKPKTKVQTKKKPLQLKTPTSTLHPSNNEDTTKPVNKTKKRGKTLVKTEKTKINIKKEKLNENCDEEDSSNGVTPNGPESTASNIFDTFIQKILSSDSNAEQLIDKLRGILSEEEMATLLNVRTSVVQQQNTENEIENDGKNSGSVIETTEPMDTESSSTKNPISQNEEETKESSKNVKSPPAPSTNSQCKPKKSKRNELDRLHEDIRDMFISSGVLTATGKRMCSMHADEVAAAKANDETRHTRKRKSTSPAAAAAAAPLPTTRKAKVVIKSIKLPNSKVGTRRSIRGRQTKEEVIEENKDDECEDDNETLATRSDISNFSYSTQFSISYSSTNSSKKSDISSASGATTTSSYTKSENEPLRCMPTLKPIKPLQIPEVDELDEWLEMSNSKPENSDSKPEQINNKKKRYKPCPKSKKPVEALMSDEEDANQNNYCDINIPNTDLISDHNDERSDSGNHGNTAEKSNNITMEIKTEKLDISVPFMETSMNANQDMNIGDMVPLNNINPKWHTVSKYSQFCVICKRKITFISMHYKKNHKEHYSSRLAPIILEQFKRGNSELSKPILKSYSKNGQVCWLFRCPFCLQFKRCTLLNWLEHFIIHTGEYCYECTLCHASYNKLHQIEKHMKDKCAKLNGRYMHNDEFKFTAKQNVLRAHVCHLCNYIRLGRASLERHYMNQHGYEAKNIDYNLGYTIELLNVENVQTVATMEESIHQEVVLNTKFSIKIDLTAEGEEPSRIEEIEDEEKANFEADAQDENRTEGSPCKDPLHLEEDEKPLAITEPATTLLKSSISSAFLSTTDDSNDGAASSSVLAKSLLTANETDSDLASHSSSPSKPTGTISIADRLSQRIKEVEASSCKRVDLVASEKRSAENEISTDIPQESKEVSQTDLAAHSNNDDEIDLTMDGGDDDDWEDIEVEESSPMASPTIGPILASSNNVYKESKMYKNKINAIQRFSRLYATVVPKKKSNDKQRLSKANELESNTEEKKKIPTTTESSSSSTPSEAPSSSLGFRPLIANIDEFLSNSLIEGQHSNQSVGDIIAPTATIEELSDITSLLDVNLNGILDMDVEEATNSVCIYNTDNQQTSIHEALNLATSQTQEENLCDTTTEQPAILSSSSSPPLRMSNPEATTTTNRESLQISPSVSVTPISRIENIGFNFSGVGYKFYCLSNCTFLYSSEAIGLENHFLFEHPQTKWSGYCNACAAQIMIDPANFELPFSEEIKHLLEAHITLRPMTSPTTNLTLPNSQEVHQQSTVNGTSSETNKTTSCEQPRLKIRRFSGDCLSAATGNNDSCSAILSHCEDDSILSLSDLIRFNTETTNNDVVSNDANEVSNIMVNNNVEVSNIQTCLEDEIPLYKKVSDDFEIVSISSGLEPAEHTEIVNQARNMENPTAITTSSLQISNVVSLSATSSSTLHSLLNPVSSSEQTIETDPTSRTSTDLQLPKITSVCSLNSKKSNAQPGQILLPGTSLNALRSDSPDRPMVVSETLPVAQATAGDFVITQTVSAQYSDEQAKKSLSKPKLGFNISIATANLSSSLTSPVGILNVSSKAKPTLNCMEMGCKFETRHFIAMIDHAKMHERRNDPTKNEFLRCSLCKEKLENIDAYTNHISTEHYNVSSTTNMTKLTTAPHTQSSNTILPTTPSSLPKTTCDLTERIRSILQKNQTEIVAKPIEVRNAASEKEVSKYKEKLIDNINEMVASTGLSECKLYRCLVKDCNVRLDEANFHTHVLYHLTTLGTLNNGSGTNFLCPHCKAKYAGLSDLKAHMRIHARHNFFCYLCLETAADAAGMLVHFSNKHWKVKEMKSAVLASTKSSTYYVSDCNELNETDIENFGKKLIRDWNRKKAATRTHFNPDEIDLLPLQAIFSKEIFCKLCMYKTKVRTNMVRHMLQHQNTPTSCTGISNSNATVGNNGSNMLQFSSNQQNTFTNDQISMNNLQPIVANMDPVNPVPCLNSSERHFDRMTNLASSSLGNAMLQGGNTNATSLATGSNPNSTTDNAGNGVIVNNSKPRFRFIPETKRFTCGVPGCQYLTVSDDIFRSHITTLHSEIRSYTCPFCCEDLRSNRTLSVDRILQHLRYHDRVLYQCEFCDYTHYIRHVVERHASDKHAQQNSRVSIIMYARKEENEFEGIKRILTVIAKKPKEAKIGDNVANSIEASSTTAISGYNINPNASTATLTNQQTIKFICCLCGHKTQTHNQIVSHCAGHHGSRQPYRCSYCMNFKAWNEKNVKLHIKERHPGENFTVERIFRKLNPSELGAATPPAVNNLQEQRQKLTLDASNTRPLWLRDDPNRIRQIRGIPMEDEEDIERFRKRLRLSEDYSDDDDDDDDGNSQGEVNTNATNDNAKLSESPSSAFYLNRFEFGCFHCSFKSNSLDDLKTAHWEKIHNDLTTGDAQRPFLFRLLLRVKCAECLSFSGCYWELEKHLKAAHGKANYFAADARMKKLCCAYCDYECNSATLLQRHHSRIDHQTDDLKSLTSVLMAQVSQIKCINTAVPIKYLQCSLCSELFASNPAILHHASDKHGSEVDRFVFSALTNTTIYRCSICAFASTNELSTLRHMIDHYARFKTCHFCYLPQTTFNGYMQHCYSEHRTEIRRFSDIYPLNDIKKFLLNMFIIFPNGWTISKKNLRQTPYGNDERLKILYAEICKISQEPPIPRLPLGRLVARKSIEARQQQQQLQQQQPEDDLNGSAQKILKRRSTVAFGNDELKKQKLSSNVAVKSDKVTTESVNYSKVKSENLTKDKTAISTLKPYSFYGQRPESEDWSKIYTKVSIAGVSKPITLDKFKLLVQVEPKVMVEKLDINKIRNGQYKVEDFSKTIKSRKPCPASQKYRFI